MKLRQGDQPLPVANDRPDIQSMVIADIEARRQLGIQRYGTALQAHNGRDSLRDAYEEALDLACYLRQAIEERKPNATAHEHRLVVESSGMVHPACACGWGWEGSTTAAIACRVWQEHAAAADTIHDQAWAGDE